MTAPLIVVGVLPVRAEPDQLAVEVDADSATHADHHCLAIDGVESLLVMLDEILGDEVDALLGADYCFELCPTSLQPLLTLYLLALGGLLELLVNERVCAIVKGNLGEAVLVVDGDGGAVAHSLLDVVDADVIAEYRACVRVRPARLEFP